MIMLIALGVVLAIVLLVHCWRATLIVLGVLGLLLAWGASLTPQHGAGSITYQSGYR